MADNTQTSTSTEVVATKAKAKTVAVAQRNSGYVQKSVPHTIWNAASTTVTAGKMLVDLGVTVVDGVNDLVGYLCEHRDVFAQLVASCTTTLNEAFESLETSLNNIRINQATTCALRCIKPLDVEQKRVAFVDELLVTAKKSEEYTFVDHIKKHDSDVNQVSSEVVTELYNSVTALLELPEFQGKKSAYLPKDEKGNYDVAMFRQSPLVFVLTAMSSFSYSKLKENQRAVFKGTDLYKTLSETANRFYSSTNSEEDSLCFEKGVFLAASHIIGGYFLTEYLKNETVDFVKIRPSSDAILTTFGGRIQHPEVYNLPATTYNTGADVTFESVLRTFLNQFVYSNKLFGSK